MSSNPTRAPFSFRLALCLQKRLAIKQPPVCIPRAGSSQLPLSLVKVCFQRIDAAEFTSFLEDREANHIYSANGLHLLSASLVQNEAERVQVPQVVLVHGTHGPHIGHLGSQSNELEPDVGAGLDSQALMVCELGRCGVGIVDTVLGNGLEGCQSTVRQVKSAVAWLTWFDVKILRGPARAKKPCVLMEVSTTASTLSCVSTQGQPWPSEGHTVSPLKGRHTTAR